MTNLYSQSSARSTFRGLKNQSFKSTKPLSSICAAAMVLGLGAGHALAQRPLGVDVSDFQGSSINWTSVKGAGITFAWTKATQGAPGQYVSQASFTINENGGKAA